MTPLDTLAPDQRAVLELLLRQGRSYAELSELLGLEEDAVRDRAHTALAALAPDRAAPIGEDGAVADWILGQVSGEEANRTRDSISRMPAWRDWAAEVTDRLGEVDGATVPAVPEVAAAETPKPRPAAAKPKQAAKPRGSRPRPVRDAEPAAPAPKRRAKERASAAPAVATAGGGAILIAVLALVIGAFLFWFLGRGDDNGSPPAAAASATATPTATPQVVVQVPLKGVGNKAQGLMQVVKRDDGKLAFALGANKIPANKAREVYAVWFTKKGGAPRNLGYAQARVGKNGVFTTGGPQQGQETQFAQWLTQYDTVIVARADANSANAKKPGQIVLSGTLPGGQ
jgi:pyruvate/2-oxoglutarate dehydrogenase complex dihydrolipoamide acyltransferase (E2) component